MRFRSFLLHVADLRNASVVCTSILGRTLLLYSKCGMRLQSYKAAQANASISRVEARLMNVKLATAYVYVAYAGIQTPPADLG